MTNQKNELPDEVFLERMFLCQGAEPMTHGTVYAGISDLEKRDLEKYVRADLRPAKAVQGEVAPEKIFVGLDEYPFGYLDEDTEREKALKCCYRLEAIVNQLDASADIRSEVFDLLKPIRSMINKAALTPESEGIAGKGEKPDRECIMFLMSLGFTHKIENGFHVVEGHGFKYSHIGILNIAHRIRQTFFDTLARPQEIDVEALSDIIMKGWNKHSVMQGKSATFGSVSRAIAEDLAALIAQSQATQNEIPDGKKDSWNINVSVVEGNVEPNKKYCAHYSIDDSGKCCKCGYEEKQKQ